MISVCIPVYNGYDYIKWCIESVLKQKGVDFEIIVYSDGSTDATVDNILSIQDSRIRLTHCTENYGIGKARNRCIENAKGEYLTFLSHDDFYANDKVLESLMHGYLKAKEANKQPVFLYSSYDAIDEKIGKTFHINAASFNYIDDQRASFMAQARFNTMYVNFSTIFSETSMFRKFMFKDYMRQSEDLEFLMRSSIFGNALYVKSDLEHGIMIRMGNNTTSRTFLKIPEINKKMMGDLFGRKEEAPSC